GWYLVRDRDYPQSNATYTILATIGGALVGGAIGIAIDDTDYLPLLLDLGGMAGFAIMASSNEAATRARTSSTGTQGFLDGIDADVHVHPAGLLPATGYASRNLFVPPLVSASVRW
ncbi:MAG: hypothetical protein ACKO9V_06285, partial [Candidatus Kapaibacterium sp.]